MFTYIHYIYMCYNVILEYIYIYIYTIILEFMYKKKNWTIAFNNNNLQQITLFSMSAIPCSAWSAFLMPKATLLSYSVW